jgi:hypothetical protein
MVRLILSPLLIVIVGVSSPCIGHAKIETLPSNKKMTRRLKDSDL